MNGGEIVKVRGLVTRFGQVVVHDGLDLSVSRGEIIGVIGGSGSGKSVLLRALIMLIVPSAGTVELFGQPTTALDPEAADRLRRRFGVLFQHSALFSSLSVLENVSYPLREHTALSPRTTSELAMLKLSLTGLPSDAVYRYPRELSGGMTKRVALARALAMDPELLFLDEPSTGLDPVSANAFDELIVRLKRDLDLTVLMVTHDLDCLWRTTDRVAFLGDKRVLAVGTMDELSRDTHPAIMAYFQGPRGRNAKERGWIPR